LTSKTRKLTGFRLDCIYDLSRSPRGSLLPRVHNRRRLHVLGESVECGVQRIGSPPSHARNGQLIHSISKRSISERAARIAFGASSFHTAGNLRPILVFDGQACNAGLDTLSHVAPTASGSSRAGREIAFIGNGVLLPHDFLGLREISHGETPPSGLARDKRILLVWRRFESKAFEINRGADVPRVRKPKASDSVRARNFVREIV